VSGLSASPPPDDARRSSHRRRFQPGGTLALAARFPAPAQSACSALRNVQQPLTTPPSGPKRFLQAMLPVAVMLTFELNVFFLKYALWVPPTNPLNTYRLILW
jgi:hypothetical protein